MYFFMQTLSVFEISLKKVKKPNTNTSILPRYNNKLVYSTYHMKVVKECKLLWYKIIWLDITVAWTHNRQEDPNPTCRSEPASLHDRFESCYYITDVEVK
jgi:hypothetical protein